MFLFAQRSYQQAKGHEVINEPNKLLEIKAGHFGNRIFSIFLKE